MQQIVKIEIISKMYQLFRAIARNNDAKDADDTVSDSLLHVLESEEKFNELPTKSIIALIIAISKKKLIDKQRKSVRDKNAYQSFIEQFCSDCSNDEYEEWFKETLEMVYQAMSDFKTEEIELIRWHYFDDMTFKQIGARMKKSPEAVQKQHERLLKRIRDAVIPPPQKACQNLIVKKNKYCRIFNFKTIYGYEVVQKNKFFENWKKKHLNRQSAVLLIFITSVWNEASLNEVGNAGRWDFI